MRRLAKFFWIGTSIFLSFGSAAQAQLSRVWADKESGSWYFSFGAGKIDTQNLNLALERAGYSVVSRSPLNDLGDSFVSLGGGSHGVVNGVVVGWELQGLFSRETTTVTGSHKSSLSGGYGFVDVGYLAYTWNGLDLYPLLGIGIGGLTLKIAERSTPAFSEVLANPNRGAELKTGGLLLNPSIGLDRQLSFSGDGKREEGVVFGLRLGYVLSPLKGGWELAGTEISAGPQASPAGPYARLTLGMGSRKVSR